jgi:hypothetical protein
VGRSELIVKDKGFAALFKRAQEIKKSYVRVGVLADSDKGGLHVLGGDLTAAEIAAVLEFGTEDGSIPARPVVRSTFDEKRNELIEMGKKLMTAVIDGKMSIKAALDILGLSLVTAMKLKITSGPGVPPPNAQSTIRAKGSSRPWVDTGRLLNSFTWSVVIDGAGEGSSEE